MRWQFAGTFRRRIELELGQAARNVEAVNSQGLTLLDTKMSLCAF
jgi:hypothetical protein